MDASWEYVLSLLTKNGKIERAAIVTENGTVTSSPSPDFSENDINCLRCSMSGSYSSLMKIKFCGTTFTCLPHGDDNDTIVGRAGDEILVAHKCSNGVLIIGLGHVETPGSCLYEVTSFAKKMESRRQRYSRRMSQYSWYLWTPYSWFHPCKWPLCNRN